MTLLLAHKMLPKMLMPFIHWCKSAC